MKHICVPIFLHIAVPLPSYRFNAHFGPVHSVERSPFFRDIVLTVGGYTWSLWEEGAEVCKIASLRASGSYCESYVEAGG